MRGWVRSVDPSGALTVETDAPGDRELPAAYVAGHLEHAYALTGHGTQGGTVERAFVVGAPEDFTRNYAYTSLSRAREPTRIYVDGSPPGFAAERAEVAPDERQPPAMARLARAMRRRDDEDLALDRFERLGAELDEDPESAAERAEREAIAAADLRLHEPLTAEEARVIGPEPERAAFEDLRAAAGSEVAERVAGQKLERDPQLRELEDEALDAEAERIHAELSRTLAVSPARGAWDESQLRAELDAARERLAATEAEGGRLGRLRRAERERLARRMEGHRRAIAQIKQRLRARDASGRPAGAAAGVDRDEAAGRLFDVERERAERRYESAREAIGRATTTPPQRVLEALGARPDDPAKRQSWDRAARLVAGYETRHGAAHRERPPRVAAARFAWWIAEQALRVGRRERGLPREQTPDVGIDR